MLANWHILLAVFVFGLCVGSFLNVVIYRLPKMMERQSKLAYNQYIEEEGIKSDPLTIENVTLSTPASSCRQCGHLIRWYENIPLLSWLYLRGKCSNCSAAIGIRYPMVELTHALLWTAISWRYGITPLSLGYMLLATALLTLFWIDWDTQLLPDDITLPLLWAGFLLNAFVPHVRLMDAVIGAAAGYLVLWGVYHLFRLATGKEGMGYGDFKLLAALGAWFGWAALPPFLLASSLAGALVGGGLMLTGKLQRGQAFAFGPFLAIVGLIAIFVRPERWLATVLG